MSQLPQTSFAKWRYAAKPASWPKLLVPFALGQAIGIGAGGQVRLSALALGAAFTVFDLLFIVYLNDWGDREVDTLKRQLFPDGCSPKTIPDKILPARSLLLGGLLAGVLAMLVVTFGAYLDGRWGLVASGFAALFVFIAYSLPPIALNYRGGGELLEMLGVGIALPLFQASWQSESLGLEHALPLGGFACVSLASAIASGLSDEQSDRQGGKRTFASVRGNAAARRAITACMWAGVLVWLGTGAYLASGASGLSAGLRAFVPCGAAALLVAAHMPGLAKLSPTAVTNAFGAQGKFKHLLHLAVWRSALLLAVLMLGLAFL